MSRRCVHDAASALTRNGPARSSCRRTMARCVASTATRHGRTYATAPPSRQQHIAVVGGGITGLTTAYYLAKELPSSAHITIYEGSDRLGGWIRTDTVPVNVSGVGGDVAFERGPRSLTSLSRDMRRFDDLVLYNLALDLGLRLYSPAERPRYLFYPDHLVRMPPLSPLDYFREPLFRKAVVPVIKGFLSYFRYRDGKNAFMPKEDLSIAEWLYRHTGSHVIGDNVLSAMVHGIHGGDITKLSARSALDGLYWRVHAQGGVSSEAPYVMERHEFDLMQKLSRDPLVCRLALEKRDSSMIHFGPKGMQALPMALESALRDAPNVTIKLNSPVRNIAPNNGDGTVHVLSTTKSPKAYNNVISTILAEPLSKITNNKVPSLANTQNATIMTVSVWYPLENIKPPGIGYLIPRATAPGTNPEHALGVFFDSDVDVGGGPEEPKGTKLFVLMGGHYYDGKTPPTEEEAIAQAKAVLERHLGIPHDTPCFAMARLARDCIPQHVVGHRKTMGDAHRELYAAFGGKLTVAGGSYTRPGALAGLRAGYDAAMSVIDGQPATGLELFANERPDMLAVSQDAIRVRRFPKKR